MKKLLLFCFVITFQFSFGQSYDLLKIDLFEKNKNESFFKIKNQNTILVQYDELVSVNNKLIKNTTENKFSFDSKRSSSLTASITTKRNLEKI